MFLIERFRKVRARMRADAQKGSAAIEFAVVAPVFFVLLLGTFEAAVIFFSQTALQSAMSDMGRLIRTGQVACYKKDADDNCLAAMTKDEFRAELCKRASTLIDCTHLVIGVEAFDDYGGLTRTEPLENGQLKSGLDKYEIGAACQVVLARAFYTWKVSAPVLSWFLVNMADGNRLVTAATAFRNEPYTTSTGGC
jgi:hypothetical protein